MLKSLSYPFQNELLLRKQKSIRRELLTREGINYIDKRIAILGGSTTADFKNILEIFLLASGIRPSFYESEYNKYYEDSVFSNPALEAFGPQIIFLYTSSHNIQNYSKLSDSKENVQEKIKAEYRRYETIWECLATKYPSAVIIQNNFDPPCYQPEGNLDAVLPQGQARFVAALNEEIAAYARSHSGFYVHDLARVAMEVGLRKWHNRAQYHAYKFAMDYDVLPDVAWSAARLIRAILGKTKKVLVLDLDNTLWGGVIGDDGVNGIVLGHETPEGEAFIEWQRYLKHLQERGVLLAVCSKNEEENAKEGFAHPDSVLVVEDFVAFHANWEPKDSNIRQIAKELNLGLDSFVFIDDNPAERALVRQSLPEVAVPEVDSEDVTSYIRAIEGNGYFDTAALSDDDFQRSRTYQENWQREALAANTGNYEEFLQSLHMEAEIGPFREIYFDRITQLTNKTNQFNLTTWRCTLTEIQQMANDENYITLYGRLKDKYGDNGLVSVVIGKKRGEELHVILWLMSCRVLKRDMEFAMLDALMTEAKKADIKHVIGYYFPTSKNRMVEDFYRNCGFRLKRENEQGTVWMMPITGYCSHGHYIAVKGESL